jgi:hypothetical protein
LPGQYEDNETVLHYNYHRYYDPLIGKYQKADPLSPSHSIIIWRAILNKAFKQTVATPIEIEKIKQFIIIRQLYGRFIRNPLSLNTGIYVINNPIGYLDPLGLEYVIAFTEGAGDSTYDANVTVTDSTTGELVFNGMGSTLPNRPYIHNTVATGSYSGTNTIMWTKKRPGIYIGETPTAPGSPANSATQIFIHCGDSATNRGSMGCLTIEPKYCDDFFRLFGPEEQVTVTVSR